MFTSAMDIVSDLSPDPGKNLEDIRWEAVRRRDRAFDETFWYSVATTGVYCRPSCAARLALRKNVAFHDSQEQAVRAGFRPCKRCAPEKPSLAARQAEGVARACRLIEQAIDGGDPVPALADLAEAVGLSRFHFHRVFRSIAGGTPKDYAAACRAGRVREALTSEPTVTVAIYEAGYGSNSRFYEHSAGMLGMNPTAWRKGGAGQDIKFAVAESSLGPVLVAATARGVCAIQFGADPEQLVRDLQDRFERATLIGADAAFERLVADVVGLIEAPRVDKNLPLDVRGTLFQQKVWRALKEIPAGRTASYTEIAARIGAPSAVRAVAGACAANPAAVAIPCHRVVRADGDLAGYRWGIERKRALLAREAA